MPHWWNVKLLDSLLVHHRHIDGGDLIFNLYDLP